MADRLIITTFGIGQGLCNLIEVYDQDTVKLEYLALADCGSTSRVKENRTDYVKNVEDMFQYIAGKAKERYNITRRYCFDAVFLSHQDADHWNLMMELFSRLLGIEKGERISIKDDEGRCTQYLIEDEMDEVITIYSDRTDNLSRTINVSIEAERYEGTYRVSSYGRTWHEYNVQFLSPYEDIEISYSDEQMAGTVIGTRKVEDGSITINYTAGEDEENREEASYLNDKDNHYMIYQNQKIDFPPQEIDLITALWIFLANIQENPIVSEMKQLLEQNGGIDLDTVINRIDTGQTLEKVVQTVYFGGTDYGPKANSFKVKLSNLAEKAVTITGDNIEICGGRIRFRIISPLFMYSLYRFNKYIDRVPIRISRNRSSLFVIIYYSGDMIILPGDATYHTMEYFCFLARNSRIKITGTTKYLVAPHHGSDTTSINERSNYTTLNNFLSKIKPERIAVSSGIMNRHHHPGEKFISNALKVAASANKHNVYVYTNDAGYTYVEINKDICTTVVDDDYRDIRFDSASVSSKNPVRKGVRGDSFRELPRKDLFV